MSELLAAMEVPWWGWALMVIGLLGVLSATAVGIVLRLPRKRRPDDGGRSGEDGVAV